MDHHLSNEAAGDTPVVQKQIEKNAEIISNFRKSGREQSESSGRRIRIEDFGGFRQGDAFREKTGKKERKFLEGLKKQIEDKHLDTIFNIRNDLRINAEGRKIVNCNGRLLVQWKVWIEFFYKNFFRGSVILI